MTKRNLSDLISAEPIREDDEWILLSQSIMSDEVLGATYRKFKIGQLKVKHFDFYYQFVFRWLTRHYKLYEKAPKQTIQHIFDSHKTSLGEETAEIIERYLDRLADEYVKDTTIDHDYTIKEVLPRFIRLKEASLLIQKIQNSIDHGKIDQIEAAITSCTLVNDEDIDPNLGTVIPGSISEVKNYFNGEASKADLFKMPGVLGDFIGPISRCKLYAITGVEKSGKTYFMQEFGIQAVIHNKLKALDINLEVPLSEKQERFWQRLGGYAIAPEYTGNLITPIFDCENNQYGTCEVLSKPINKEPLLMSKDEEAVFENNKDWIPCTRCRESRPRLNTKKTKRFVPAIWYIKEESKTRLITEQRLIKTINRFLPFGLTNYRMRCFPRYSQTFEEVEHYIKSYIKLKKFHPDLILLDYPDILLPVDGKLMDRFNIDAIWKQCARLAQELNCAIIVADQAKKEQRANSSLSDMSTTEDKRKDAHLDLRLTINKTPQEAILGLERIGMTFRRKGRLHRSQVMITQRMNTADVLIDSEWWPSNKININTIFNHPDLM